MIVTRLKEPTQTPEQEQALRVLACGDNRAVWQEHPAFLAWLHTREAALNDGVGLPEAETVAAQASVAVLEGSIAKRPYIEPVRALVETGVQMLRVVSPSPATPRRCGHDGTAKSSVGSSWEGKRAKQWCS